MPRFSPAPVQQYRGTHSALRTYVGPEGELVMDTTQGRVVVMDGKTAGGIPLARLDELTGATFTRMDGAVDLDGTAGESIRYYITVDGSATIPEGVTAPYWVWNYIVDDETTKFTLQFLRATDGSIYNREGSEVDESPDWSEWTRIGGGSADEFVTLDTEQTITGQKTFSQSYTGVESDEGTYAGFALKTTVPYDEIPEEAEYPGIWITDRDGYRIGKFEYTLSTSGARSVQMCVSPTGTFYEGSDKQIRIRIGCTADGETVVELGDLTVGDTSTPIYLNKGVPTACGASDIAVQMVAATPNCYRRSELMTPNQTSITIHPTQVNINGNGYISTTDVTLQLSDALSASSRAGTDMYVYACEPSSGTVPTFVLSANSTVPSGYTADTSRKIGGFHCLCAAVGTISGHTLSGYAQGDILPASVWDLRFRAVSENEGMVYDPRGFWVDIYLASVGSDGLLASAFGASPVTGVSSVPMHGEMFNEELQRVKKHLPSRDQYVMFVRGTEAQDTDRLGSLPSAVGGHTLSKGYRSISNIGVEDGYGVYYQWTNDVYGAFNNEGTSTTYQYGGANTSSESYGLVGFSWETNSLTRIGNDAIDGDRAKWGNEYGCLVRVHVGGGGTTAQANCGSRCVSLDDLSAIVNSNFAGRGAAEPRVASDV